MPDAAKRTLELKLVQLQWNNKENIFDTKVFIQEAKEKGAGLPHALNLATVNKEGQPSSRCKRPECDHEGLFYHHGQGKKGWAAVVPPGGLQ